MRQNVPVVIGTSNGNLSIVKQEKGIRGKIRSEIEEIKISLFVDDVKTQKIL